MQKTLKNYQNGSKSEERTRRDAAELLNKYGNMSEDALFAALMQEVASEKSDGTFDINELSSSLDKMRPFLSPAQNEKLNHLLGLIGS